MSKLKEYREKRKMPQKEVAAEIKAQTKDKINICHVNICWWETLKRKPKENMLELLINILKIPKEDAILLYWDYYYLHPDIKKKLKKNPSKCFELIINTL